VGLGSHAMHTTQVQIFGSVKLRLKLGNTKYTIVFKNEKIQENWDLTSMNFHGRILKR
jgi:hypothetical protein